MDVPKVPSVSMMNLFSSHFANEAEVHASQDSGPELVPLRLVQIGIKMSSNTGAIARQARLVEEHILEYTQVRLARLGFASWCPDLRQTPYALYNSACRIVALDTFKQALVSRHYDHLGPRLSYAYDLDLLTKLYDHFVHFYMYNRFKKELNSPGAVYQELKSSPAYQNRVRVRTTLLNTFSLPDSLLSSLMLASLS